MIFIRRAFISLVFVCAFNPWARANVACLAVLEQYKDKGVEHYTELTEVVKLLQTVDTNLLNGTKKPTFQDVDVLEKISALMVKAERFKGEQRQEIFAKLKDTLPQSSVAVSEGSEPMNAADYKPNEAELKSLYQSVWNRVASELPKEMGLPLIKISYRLQKKAELRKQGKEILEHSEKTFEELFSTTSNFETFDAYAAKLAEISASDASRKAIVEMIDSEGVEVVIQRPENARWWSTKIGLHNQHVTGTSKGYTGKAGRNATEATYADMSLEDFSAIDDTVKPVYGHVQPAPSHQGQFAKATGASHYGSDGFVVNIDKIRDRLSFTFGGDSLNRASSFIPSWSRGVASTPTSWDHTFIPWKYRALVADSVEGTSLSYKGSRSSPTGLKNKAGIGSDYVEIQVHGGGVDMSEVSAFEFSNKPPADDFLISLRKEGLEVRRRTGNSTTVWEEDLAFKDLKVVKSQVELGERSVDIQSVTLREVTFKNNVLDPQYEWVVDIASSEDLGAFTHRLKLVDAGSPDRRIHPTVARVDSGGPPYTYRVRVPDVKLHDVGNLYVRMKSADGKSIVHSNEGKPKSFFTFNAIGD